VGLPSVPTAVIGAVGVCQRGPVGVARLTTSFPDWVKIFGGFITQGDAAIAAMGFFLQVGTGQFWQVRTVHYTTGVKTSSQSYIDLLTGTVGAVGKGRVISRNPAPYSLVDSDTLELKVDGGAPVVVTFTATSAVKESVGVGNYNLSVNDTLTIQVDGGIVQSHTFVPSDFPGGSPLNNITTLDMALAINANFTGVKAETTSGGTKVTVSTDRVGSGAALVFGGSANTVLGFISASGTGNLSDAKNTTVAQLKTIIEGFVSGVTVSEYIGRLMIERSVGGSTKSVEVDAASTSDATDKLNLDNNVHNGEDGNITYGKSAGSIAGPWTIAEGDTIDISVDGGGTQTATFSGVQATIESVNSETLSMAGGKTLNISVDGGLAQPITFVDGDFAVPAAATADEVAHVINKQLTGGYAIVTSGGLKVSIRSDSKGLSSSIKIVSGTANTVWDWDAPNTFFGSGNVNSLDAVTFEEAKSVIEAAVSGVVVVQDGSNISIERVDPGATKTVQVEASSTADSKFGFDNSTYGGTAGAAVDTLKIRGKDDGSYPGSTSVVIEDATSGDASEFNLVFKESGVTIESFPNVTMDSSVSRYVIDVLADPNNPSIYYDGVDLAAPGTALEKRPVNGTYTAWTVPANADGLTAIDYNDFVGLSAYGNGLYALDTVDTITLVIIPGQASANVHLGMITYVETARKGLAFTILDPPASLDAPSMVTYVDTTAGLLNLSDKAAIYWPRIQIANPDKNIYGSANTVIVAPSGFIAGVYARNDLRTGGVYEAPAGVDLGIIRGCVGFETEEVLKEAVRDVVYPKLINPITKLSGFARHIDGSRTLKETSPFPTIGERRGVIFIEKTLYLGLQFARHRNNTKKLRMRLKRTTVAFLLAQLRVGAFRTDVPRDAFSVDYGDSLNPPTEQFARRVNGRIALATAKPTEYVVLKFAQDERALLEEIAEATG
jgi:hypothetical protein